MTIGPPAFGRVPRFRIGDLDPAQQGLLDMLAARLDGKLPRSIVDDDGLVTGGFNYLLLEPRAGSAFIALGDELGRALPARLREIVVLEVTRILDSVYERQAHEPLARRAGVTDAELEALRSGAPASSFTDEERIVREVVSAAMERRDVPDDMYAQAVACLGAAQLWTVVTLAGYYAMMQNALVTFRAPLLDRT